MLTWCSFKTRRQILLLLLLQFTSEWNSERIITRKTSCRWQTRATLAKRLHGWRKSSWVVSCIASLPIDSSHMVSYYRPIVTLCLKCTVFEIWRHIGWKSPKNPPHPHLARSFGVTPCEFSRTYTLPETRIMGLSDGVHLTILLSLCYAQYRHVTDVRTDRRTDMSLSQRPR